MIENLTSLPTLLGAPTPAALARVQAMKNDELRLLILAQLPEIDDATEWHTPSDLAPLMGVRRQALYCHLSDLYPNHQGEWRLSREETERLVKRVVQAGNKVRFAVALRLSAHVGGHHAPIIHASVERRNR